MEVGGERWSTNQAAPRETASSGKYKAQGRTVALHLLGTSGCMRLSETTDLEIVGQGSSEELKPESCHIGKHLCPGQVSLLQASLHALVSHLFTQVLAEEGAVLCAGSLQTCPNSKSSREKRLPRSLLQLAESMSKSATQVSLLFLIPV